MKRRLFAIASLLAALTSLAGPASAEKDDLAPGRAEYEVACMGCHGAQGRGDGPMAAFLTITPADLTRLSRNNNGQYPFLKVFQTIDGRAVIRGHGDGAMPIWGDRYKAGAGAGIEPYRSFTSEPLARARILELTYFIQSLQE